MLQLILPQPRPRAPVAFPQKASRFISSRNTTTRLILPRKILENFQTSGAYISKTFDLNDMKFGKVVKKSFFITFQKFGPVAPTLRNIAFDDVV